MKPTPSLVACAVALAAFLFALVTHNPMTGYAVAALAVCACAYGVECSWRRVEAKWRVQELESLRALVAGGHEKVRQLADELRATHERVTIIDNRTQVRSGR